MFYPISAISSAVKAFAPESFTHFSWDSCSFPVKDKRVTIGRWADRLYSPHFSWTKGFRCLPIGLNLPLLPKIGFNLYVMEMPTR